MPEVGGKARSRRWKNRGNSFLRSPSLRQACDSQDAPSGWIKRPTGVPTDLTCLPSKHRPRLRLAKGDSSYLAVILSARSDPRLLLLSPTQPCSIWDLSVSPQRAIRLCLGNKSSGGKSQSGRVRKRRYLESLPEGHDGPTSGGQSRTFSNLCSP